MNVSRKALTLSEKRRILAECDRRSELNQPWTPKEIAIWERQELNLGEEPNMATFTRIIRHPAFLRATPSEICDIRKRRSCHEPKLEKELFACVCQQNAKILAVTGPVVRVYAERLQKEANNLLSPDQQLRLKFSQGWRTKFKERFQLRFRKVNGEARSADTSAINDALPYILESALKYAARDVFNADVFGLFTGNPRRGHYLSTQWKV